jgi:hypothetical protein
MPTNLASCLLKDFVYQQDHGTAYIMQDGKFVPVDRDAVADAILINLDKISNLYLGPDDRYAMERTYDPFALNQALCRYSRDIFGEQRLAARITYVSDRYRFSREDAEEIGKYEDYGFKVDSISPYLHRRIAGLFYWFSVLKPFRVLLKAAIGETEQRYIYLEYHNEWTTYLLVMMVLKCVNRRINIHESPQMFRQFLYVLHYRTLSRSALEFFLNHHIETI